MELEYIGELLSDGHLSVEPSVLKKVQVGEKLRVRIQTIKKKTQGLSGKFDPATERILARMRKAKNLGVSENPEALRHSVLFEERIEGKS
jgi:chaperonin cofactor prefoldin